MDREHGDLNQDGLAGVDDYVRVLTYRSSRSPPDLVHRASEAGLAADRRLDSAGHRLGRANWRPIGAQSTARRLNGVEGWNN